jgi:monothiol glutaredoxin
VNNDLTVVFDFIKTTIESNKIVLFMKGDKKFPQCGFSSQVVSILQFNKINFLDVNVFQMEGLREGIKQFSNWPTIPQIYINGEFIGGSDIMTEMFESGELKKLVQA